MLMSPSHPHPHPRTARMPRTCSLRIWWINYHQNKKNSSRILGKKAECQPLPRFTFHSDQVRPLCDPPLPATPIFLLQLSAALSCSLLSQLLSPLLSPLSAALSSSSQLLSPLSSPYFLLLPLAYPFSLNPYSLDPQIIISRLISINSASPSHSPARPYRTSSTSPHFIHL